MVECQIFTVRAISRASKLVRETSVRFAYTSRIIVSKFLVLETAIKILHRAVIRILMFTTDWTGIIDYFESAVADASLLIEIKRRVFRAADHLTVNDSSDYLSNLTIAWTFGQRIRQGFIRASTIPECFGVLMVSCAAMNNSRVYIISRVLEWSASATSIVVRIIIIIETFARSIHMIVIFSSFAANELRIMSRNVLVRAAVVEAFHIAKCQAVVLTNTARNSVIFERFRATCVLPRAIDMMVCIHE